MSNNTQNYEILQTNITAIIKDLLFPSESDEPIHLFAKEQKLETTLQQLKQENTEAKISNKNWEDFFAPLILEEDWHEEEEKKIVQQFKELKQTLESQLQNCQIWLIGETQINAYLLGETTEGYTLGCQTLLIQT
ncbi:MAG: hypothetical protein EAZ55_04605 [Cytophagales bacterium]|nr:MAG: hypothetical protein EAZ55_04605 [Cytophagales bacterium]